MSDNNEHREEGAAKAEEAQTGAREAKDSPEVAAEDVSARKPRRAVRSAPEENQEKKAIGEWTEYSREVFGVAHYVLAASVAEDEHGTEYTEEELKGRVQTFLDRSPE